MTARYEYRVFIAAAHGSALSSALRRNFDVSCDPPEVRTDRYVAGSGPLIAIKARGGGSGGGSDDRGTGTLFGGGESYELKYSRERRSDGIEDLVKLTVTASEASAAHARALAALAAGGGAAADGAPISRSKTPTTLDAAAAHIGAVDFAASVAPLLACGATLPVQKRRWKSSRGELVELTLHAPSLVKNASAGL